MQVTIFTANCIGQAANCSYPNKVTVVTPEQLREAVKADHVCAEYKGNYRGIGNFIRSDVIVMDIDNDHSEEPAEWITAEKLEEIFPDMEYMLASSRQLRSLGYKVFVLNDAGQIGGILDGIQTA